LSATTWAEQVLSTAEPDQRCRLLIAADYLCMQEQLKVAIVSAVHTWAHIGNMRNWLWPQNEILHEFVGDYAPFCRLLLGAETFSEDIRRMKIEEQVRDIVIGRGGDVDLVNDAMYAYRPDVNFLQKAVLTGKVAIVEELVKVSGINVNVVNKQLGTTPLVMAIQGYGGFSSPPRNSVDLVRALLKAPDIDVNLGSALHYAVESPDRRVLVPLLVQAPGIVVNARNRYGSTPLDVAVERLLIDKMVMVEFLLNVPGIEVNHENSTSTLHIASGILWGADIVERLLKVPGIKVNALDASGWTPLRVAIDEGRIDIVEVLLRDARIDVNVPDKLSGTPLHAAVQKGNFKVVELLLNRPEIKINSRNRRNETPRTIAKYRGLRDIVKALKNAVQVQRNSKLRSYARRMLPGQGGADASDAH
ncbi:hypothetical protein PBRA_009472, partial [Plasmodiophora brassicae]